MDLATIHKIKDPPNAVAFLEQHKNDLIAQGEKNPQARAYQNIRTAIDSLPSNLKMMWYGVLSSKGYTKSFEEFKREQALKEVQGQIDY